MKENIVLMIIGMGIVTYLPRMLPLVAFKAKNIHPHIRGVLKNVPYAALGALIFPGIFMTKGHIFFGLLGALTAFLVAYLGAGLIYVVLSTIAVLSFCAYLLNVL